MRKTKVFEIVGKSPIDKKPYMLILDSKHNIVFASGNFSRYFRHIAKFTRKVSIRSELRTSPLAEISLNGLVVNFFKQLDYNTSGNQKPISKLSNAYKLKADRSIDLEGKHFFKHFVSHYLKMNGGKYEMKTLYI